MAGGRRRLGRVLVLATVLVALAGVGTPGVTPARATGNTIYTGYPNDPGWAGCESQSVLTGCTDGEEWDHFGPLTDAQFPCANGIPHPDPGPDGGLPCWASQAADDPTHMSGMNLPGAWKQGNVGRNDILVAYMEGGVNFSSDSIKDALDNEYLNTGELPCPERANGSTLAWPNCYDLDGNGRADLRDYVHDPRVNPPCPAGVAPDTAGAGGGLHVDDEGTSRNCLASGAHHYLNAVKITSGGSGRTPYLSPEDLIAVFGHCQVVQGGLTQCPANGRFDNDGNGYPNDISGWNFDRDNNDPQSEDLTYGHAPSLHSLVAGVPDNNYGSVGYCAMCRVVPIRQGAECLGRSDKWGEGILYAADLGVTAISSVVVGYSYSAFNQAAINYAYRKGVLLSLDSNDFDAMDHTDGMLFDHVLPGNSLAEDKATMTQNGISTANTVTWFRARSDVTSYGTHNIFSMEGGSTSAATPTVASVLAMVQSAGLNLRDSGKLAGFDRLTPNEVKQVLMDTSSEVVPQNPPEPVGDGAPAGTLPMWPGNPNSATDATHTNWSTQYGYGRPDVGAATAMVMAGKIPPTADLTSPHWFQYLDPATHPSVEVDGSLAPSRFKSGGSANYVLEWALGADPADSAFHTITSASTQQALSGKLGTLDLSDPAIVKAASNYSGTTLQPDGAEQYTLTLRLRVRDANGLKAEDRRTIGVHHDPSLTRGAPIDLPGSDSVAPSYADLEGKHELDLVTGSTNGQVDAFRPDGSEVPGFPVYTDRVRDINPRAPQNFPGVAAYRDPALRDIRDPIGGGTAVGDLFHTGNLDIVVTTTNGEVYAWDSHGTRLPGFPLRQDPANYLPYDGVPTPHAFDASYNITQNHPRLPDRGAWAPPVLADLEGTGKLDILMSSFDGHEYAWRPDGTAVPGWPVEVKLPPAIMARDGVKANQYIRDAKLFYPPTVADVQKVGKPQVYVSSFESNGVNTASQNLAIALAGLQQAFGNPSGATTWLYGIWADGNLHPGGPFIQDWPVQMPSLDFTYDQSIDFVGEATSPPLAADFDGSGLKLATGVVTGQVFVLNANGTVYSTMDPSCTSADCAPLPPYRNTGDTHTISLTGMGGIGDLNNTGTPQVVMNNTGLESILAGLSALDGAQLPQVYEQAWNVQSGKSPVVSGFPKRVDGFPFYESPVIADVAGSGKRAAIEGNDTYWVHAFGADGTEQPGFPKYTGQWMGFAAVIADPLMNGHLHYTSPTREGEVFDWSVAGDTALNNNWWHFRHDEHNTGTYGTDTRRPASVLDLGVSGTGAYALSWTAPGNDYMVGTADHYDIRWSTSPITDAGFWNATALSGAPAPKAPGTAQQMSTDAPSGSSVYFAMRTIDAAGNIYGMSNVVCVGTCPVAGGTPNTAAAHPHSLTLLLLVGAGVLLAAALTAAAVRRRLA